MKKMRTQTQKNQKETRRVRYKIEIESRTNLFPTKMTFMEIEKGVGKGHMNNQHTCVAVLCE